MADAGPSFSTSINASNSNNANTIPPATHSRHTRIQFPVDETSRSIPGRHEAHSKMASLGLGRPPISRRLTQDEEDGTHDYQSFVRPRVKSVDADATLSGASRSQRAADLGIEPTGSRKVTPTNRRSNRKDKNRAVDVEYPTMTSDFSATKFSNEYDLANEDPGILEDVQRALRLKARREARVKALQSNPSLRDAASTSDMASGSSFSPHPSPVRHTFPVPPPIVPPPPGISVESEIDFSPSVGVIPLHPVPSSSNGGATLDWTGSASDDEKPDKRWSISLKRKPKDKSGTPASRTVEKQETLYADKLSRIKAKVKPNTIRKATITSEQLERRYGTLLRPVSSRTDPINLLNIARWFSKQDEIVQESLDKTEPLTWLKHLLDKRGHPSTPRFPWHLTALIMEEYVKSKARPELMETIPEDGIVEGIPIKSSPPAASFTYPETRSPSASSWSWTPPRHSLEPSLSRKKPLHDMSVSFEPQVDSGRESVGADSRLSAEYSSRNRAQSRTEGTSSPHNSIHNGIFNGNWSHGLSPNNSRLHLRDLASRVRRKPYVGSEDGLSSARNSMSEQSQEEDRPPSRNAGKNGPRNLNLRSKSDLGTDDERRLSREPSEAGEVGGSSGAEGPLTAKQGPSQHASPPEQALKQSPEKAVSSPPQTAIPRFARKRVSLPSHQFFVKEKSRRQEEADEEKESLEYGRRARILNDTLAQNTRTRQILQRISANIREYENVQSGLSRLLGAPYLKVPQEVLDAFGHDPSSVISGTKRFKSWRAVDDIQERISRQRDTLRTFVASIPDEENAPSPKSVFVDPLTSLMQSLEQLEIHRTHIAREAEDVSETLANVKCIHGTVKKDYNETLSYTSLIYPELSQIVVLEESYRSHYQQIWNIGLDALTLLLDTVTPFWRNYGKVIGVDVQDFLIIPWYRNEFTGEAKRYPVKNIPRRSFRHWIGLLMFSALSATVTMLQIRAAVSSTLNYNLPWITHIGFRWMFIPFFMIGIIIQWCAVLVECCIVLAHWGVAVWWLGWLVRIFD